MGTIKSAYEIAMENTKSIEADKELLETNRLKDEGKKLVSHAMEDSSFSIKEALKAFDKKQLEHVRSGLAQSLLANLVLPQDEFAVTRIRRIGEVLVSIASETKRISATVSQLDHFFKEFLEERKRTLEALERQYAPRLKKKEEDVSRQVGRPVRINPASDPEFQGLVRQYLGQLEAKYEDVLNGVKKEIEATVLKG